MNMPINQPFTIATNLNSMNYAGDLANKLKSNLPKESGELVAAQTITNEKYKVFAQLWSKEQHRSKNDLQLAELFAGFYTQVAAGYCLAIQNEKELLQKSLKHYEQFLDGKADQSEVKYFAQWQLGLVKEALGYQWIEVERTLLEASKYNLDRGEAMRHIVGHYRNIKEYGFAYIYSSIAKKQYFNKFSPTMAWFADASYYRWKILNYHASICSNLGNIPEAEETFQTLWNCSLEHPEYFTEEQMQQIYQNKKAQQL